MNDTPEAQTYIHAQRSVDINGLLGFACCVSSVDVIFSNFSFSLVSLRRECIRFQFFAFASTPTELFHACECV